MMKKLLCTKTNSIFSAALILGAASFVSRLIGVVRSRIFADQFGASQTLDVYFAAFKIPDLVFNLLVVGALSAGFIPVFMKAYVKDKEAAWKLTNSLIVIIGAASLVFALILFIAMPWITPYIVPGFSNEAIKETVLLSRIMLLSPVILGLSSIAGGVLQSIKAFFAYALAPIVYNIGIIIGAVYLVPIFGVAGLAYGVILGTVFHLAVQLPSVFQHGFTLKPNWGWHDARVREIGKLMIPRTLAIATQQLNFFVMTIIASTLAVGSITVFTFANDLQYFAVGIIGISFALAAFPSMSACSAASEKDKMRDHLLKTARQVLMLIIPTTVLFLLLRAQIVRVVLGSGKFDWAATIATADVLAFFSLSLFAQCLIPLLTRGFYALCNTKTPLLIAFISALVNIIGSLALKDSLGVAGLALGFSIASVFQCALLWMTLRKEFGGLQEHTLLPLLYKVSLAAIGMGLGVQVIKTLLGGSSIIDMTRFWGVFLQGAIAGAAGLAIFIALAYVMHIREVDLVLHRLKRR